MVVTVVPLHQKSERMKRIVYIFLFISTLPCMAHEAWTIEKCIQYAVNHNHDVRLQALALEESRIDRTKAVGAFLPSVNGSIGGQYNFGRAIDPETNTYTDVSTFYNGYSLSASIPVFDGFQRYNDLRASRANILLGRSRLQAQKDQTAQDVLESYIKLLYCKGSVEIARRKRDESMMLLRQTEVMAQVGRKSEADVSQMRATYASDDYEVTHQQSLYDKALIALKRQMNFPMEDTLSVADCDTCDMAEPTLMESPETIYSQAGHFNPRIRQAEYNLQAARYSLRASKGALYPSLNIGAGISTRYNKQLHKAGTMKFSEQFRNNAGEYISATLSIPLFDRLSTLSSIRKSRNNVRRAEEELDNNRRELHRLVSETYCDRVNSLKEMEKMRRKVEADSVALKQTIRKYEEGLSSAIDVQTQAVTLLQSEALLLQCRLTFTYKTRLLQYYKGIPLWTE